MNRKKILTIIIVIVLISAYFLYSYVTRSTNNGVGSTILKSLFPTSLFPSNIPKTPVDATPDTNIIDTTNTEESTKVIPRLRKFTTEPVSGDIPLVKEVEVIKERIKTKENVHIVRYVDRATGHVFDINSESSSGQKISNTTVPKVYEAVFAPDGDSVLFRFLDEKDKENILTYAITLTDKKGTTTPILKDTTIKPLKDNLRELTLSPSGKKLASLSIAENSNGIIATSGFTGTGSSVVFNSPLHEWLLNFIGETKLLLTSKPSAFSNGFAYILNTATGSLQRVIGEVGGLLLLPNKDGTVFIGAGTSNGLQTFWFTLSDLTIKYLSIKTLPEKCVWLKKDTNTVICAVPTSLPDGVLPDAWYQGRVSFTDNLWKINLKTGETILISDLGKEGGQAIDVTNLILSTDDSYLTFINKKDLSLWGLDLSKEIK